jgi:CDP-diacylglycerol--glycerol-3-phosphate 3-phosphatidyltransferase
MDGDCLQPRFFFDTLQRATMRPSAFYLVNAITLYRILAAPLLVFLILNNRMDAFKWLMGISFFTDLIDGQLARKFKVTSRFGSYIDSIGDDLTVLAGIAGVYFFKPDFLFEQKTWIMVMVALFFLQIFLALIRYRRVSSFHTLLAKMAALLQGSFLILLFFVEEPLMALFYLASAVTILDLIEEIILVFLLKEWKANVRGIYWVLRNRKPVNGSSG